MSDIFISYSRQDRVTAELLARMFERQGWSVWWDRDILPGKSFDEVIDEILSSVKCIVVLWSNSSASSHWVKAEAREGLHRKILIPIKLEPMKVPLEFRGLQTADISGWDWVSYSPAMGDVMQAIREMFDPEGEAANVFPKTREQWSAEAWVNTKYAKSIFVTLSHQSLMIEWERVFGEASWGKDVIKVNTKAVRRTFLPTLSSKRKYEFQIPDGNNSYPAVIEFLVEGWIINKILRFTLTVDGKVLYAEK